MNNPKMNTQGFRDYVGKIVDGMITPHIDIRSGDIHKEVGAEARMPSCCDAMRSLMKGDDRVLQQPPRGRGSNLVIRYYRKNHI